MAEATDIVTPALSSAQSSQSVSPAQSVPSAQSVPPAQPVVDAVAGPVGGFVRSTAGPTPEMAAVVAAQLEMVLGAARPGGLCGVSSEQALQVVEAAEALKAWVDAISIDATAVMVTEFEADFEHLEPQDPSAWERRRFLRTCRSAAAREIQVATGLPITQCQRRVWFTACEPQRVAPIRQLLRLGRVPLARAMALAQATAHLDAYTASVIATRVLRPVTGPDGEPLPGMAPLSQATFTARLHRQLVLHNGLVGEAERTHEEAVKARRVTSEPQRDGTGALVITGDGPRIFAAACRVDKIARRLRNNGDERTLDQLRADVATDLLMGGWIPGDPTFTALGRPPVATVQLIVTLPTLLGLDHGVALIPGWGCVSSAQAQDLALQLGSIWKRIVTDPLTGRAIEATAGTYKVPAGMAEQIKARDGTCRAPGCEIPTERCDLDHSQEWAATPDDTGGPGGPTSGPGRPTGGPTGGPTAETNLAAVHRGHHNLKTSGFWDSDQSPEGALAWTTATGRRFTTYPYVYDHPDNLPIRTSNLEAHLGRRLAPLTNPDIPLPGHLSIFDHIDWTQALAPAGPQLPQHTWETAQANQKHHAANLAPRDPGPPPF